MRPGGRHRSSIAYRRAARLSDDLYRHVLTWPKLDRWTVGTQMIRAADSVGANIAEGFGRFSNADQRRLFLIARGSLYELEHWTERAISRGLSVPLETLEQVREISRILNGLIRADPANSL